jgi:hypothetical protein
MAEVLKSFADNVLQADYMGEFMDKKTNPLMFLSQPIFMYAYVVILVLTFFTSYMKSKPKNSANTTSDNFIFTILSLAFTFGFYAPAFYKIGSNADNTSLAWNVLKPIIAAHVVSSLVVWVLTQIQTCNVANGCAAGQAPNNSLRKFADSIIVPTRRVIEAATPFGNYPQPGNFGNDDTGVFNPENATANANNAAGLTPNVGPSPRSIFNIEFFDVFSISIIAVLSFTFGLLNRSRGGNAY